MHLKILAVKGSWRDVADAARTTVNMGAGEGEPSSNYQRRLLLSEHSPIRKLVVNWKWFNLKYFVSVHFVRHKFGIEHWVRTQRTDRTGVNRDELPQGAVVEHEAEANAQAIINVSRKRLCMKASPETREAWNIFLYGLVDSEYELVSACVPDCIYRGYCYEMDSCGFFRTEAFQQELESYRRGINVAQDALIIDNPDEGEIE